MISVLLTILLISIPIILAFVKPEGNKKNISSAQDARLRELSDENWNLKAEKKKFLNAIADNEYDKEKMERKYDKLEERYNELEENQNKNQTDFYNLVMDQIESFFNERKESYKWLSGMMADYLTLAEDEYQKNFPLKKIEDVGKLKKRENINKKNKELIKENRILKYEIDHIKVLLPDAEDIVEYDSLQGESTDEDHIYKYISREEYDLLSDTEKNARALEYYQRRKKSNWEIGRDFERYVGYLFERDGGEVKYFGMEKGLGDLGRDLIVAYPSGIYIVQCKYWSKNKLIHEKHIAQLYGTLVKYRLDHPKEKRAVTGLFVTHTQLSEEAKRFARALGIDTKEGVELGEYPMIKCHNGQNEYGLKTRIYHLPMDQRYDATVMNKKDGDFWALTVGEAEEAGYRRAHRWLPWNQAQ